jgi:hypothetical protein
LHRYQLDVDESVALDVEAPDALEPFEPRAGNNARQAWLAAAKLGSLRLMLGGGPPLDVDGTDTPWSARQLRYAALAAPPRPPPPVGRRLAHACWAALKVA